MGLTLQRVSWGLVAIVIGFGVWAVPAGSGWERWSDFAAGVIAALAGTIILSAGRRFAGGAWIVAAIGWFAGTAAATVTPQEQVHRALVVTHRPLALIALVATSMIAVPRAWARPVLVTTGVMFIVWAATQPVIIGRFSVAAIAGLFVMCSVTARPLITHRWRLAWLPFMACSVAAVVVTDAALMSRGWTVLYEVTFALTATLCVFAAVPPAAKPERALAVDLGLVDARRRRNDVRLRVVGHDAAVTTGDTRSVVDIDDDHRLVVDHPRGTMLTSSLREELRRTGSLMADHQRLTEDLQHQTVAVARSRQRLAAATDDERERLERDVIDNVEPHLHRLATRLRSDPTTSMNQLLTEVRREIDTLRDEGIPAALADGLVPAVRALAASCPLPMQVDIDAAAAFPSYQTTIWFVITEATANVVRHAQATTLSITAARVDDHLVVSIVDDGNGGADESAGTGLTGLRERSAAVGATLRVTSDHSGTSVELVLPDAGGPGL